jgi:hypothetical protein
MVQARSIASPILDWLRDPKPIRVLHVFKDACNLIAEDGEIFSLVMPHIGDGPFNIILEPLKFSDHISAESIVSLDNGQIRIGALEIALTPAQVWEPRFDWESFQGRHDSLSLSAVALGEVLVEAAPVDSFVQLIHSGESSAREIEAQMLLSAQEPARFLVQGLLRADEELCRTSARELAGLGAGLTPDGDARERRRSRQHGCGLRAGANVLCVGTTYCKRYSLRMKKTYEVPHERSSNRVTHPVRAPW